MNEARWRHELTAEGADALLARVNAMDLARLRPAARIRGCRVASFDERLLRGAARTGLPVRVRELT